ncbi:MAG: hypothetical protein BWY06_01512 [Candidatus Latescibacteria bacterium ADurb.Bin168]|nr:MAG: hypothetical protein BWY06_01512 [Candidatus Latescibacteria bacterium ADurb.Bin168]
MTTSGDDPSTFFTPFRMICAHLRTTDILTSAFIRQTCSRSSFNITIPIGVLRMLISFLQMQASGVGRAFGFLFVIESKDLCARG